MKFPWGSPILQSTLAVTRFAFASVAILKFTRPHRVGAFSIRISLPDPTHSRGTPFPRYSRSSSESSSTSIHLTISGIVCCAGMQNSALSPSSPDTSPAVQLPGVWSW